MSCQENKCNFTSMFPFRIDPLYVGNSSLGLVTIVGFVFFRDVFFGGRICSLESSSDKSGNTNGLLLTASYNVWICQSPSRYRVLKEEYLLLIIQRLVQLAVRLLYIRQEYYSQIGLYPFSLNCSYS